MSDFEARLQEIEAFVLGGNCIVAPGDMRWLVARVREQKARADAAEKERDNLRHQLHAVAFSRPQTYPELEKQLDEYQDDVARLTKMLGEARAQVEELAKMLGEGPYVSERQHQALRKQFDERESAIKEARAEAAAMRRCLEWCKANQQHGISNAVDTCLASDAGRGWCPPELVARVIEAGDRLALQLEPWRPAHSPALEAALRMFEAVLAELKATQAKDGAK